MKYKLTRAKFLIWFWLTVGAMVLARELGEIDGGELVTLILGSVTLGYSISLWILFQRVWESLPDERDLLVNEPPRYYSFKAEFERRRVQAEILMHLNDLRKKIFDDDDQTTTGGTK